MEVVPSTPQESVQNRVGEQIVDSVLRVLEAVVEIVLPTLQERVQNRPRKVFVDLPVPLITKIMADVFGLPQERVQNRATYSGKVLPCVIIVMAGFARLAMWRSSRVWTSSTCLVLEM